jgi:hypothetical protein
MILEFVFSLFLVCVDPFVVTAVVTIWYRLPQHRYRNYLGFAGNDWIDQLGAFVNARFGTERCKDSTFRNDFPLSRL